MIRRPPRSTLFPYTRSSDLTAAIPPNARHELLPEAGARHERTLEAVSSMPLFGCGTPVGPRFARGFPLLLLCTPPHLRRLVRWLGRRRRETVAPPLGDYVSGGGGVRLTQQVRATKRRTPPVMATSATLKMPVRTGPTARRIKSTTRP